MEGDRRLDGAGHARRDKLEERGVKGARLGEVVLNELGEAVGEREAARVDARAGAVVVPGAVVWEVGRRLSGEGACVGCGGEGDECGERECGARDARAGGAHGASCAAASNVNPKLSGAQVRDGAM